MIKKRNDIRPFELVLGLIILYSVMPVVAQLFSDFLTTYAYMVILLAATVYTMTIRGTVSLADSIMLLLPFLLWMVLDYILEDPQIIMWGYSSLALLAPLLFGQLATGETGRKPIRFFAFLIIIAVLVTAVTTIVGSRFYPEASRYLASVETSNDPKLILFNRINIGGYDFVYTCVLLYPVAIFAFKRKKLRLIWMILLAVLMLLLILNAGYTTALLFFLASNAFLFFPANIKKSWVYLIIFLVVLLVIISTPIFSDVFGRLAKAVDNEDISYRLQALASGREGIEKSDDNRLYFYELSLRYFFESPIFGFVFSGATIHGGHSFILDFLAKYGLVGGTLLVFMYRLIYVKFYKPYQNTPGYGYIFWIFLQAIALSIVNPGMWISVIAWYIPILLAAVQNASTKTIQLRRNMA